MMLRINEDTIFLSQKNQEYIDYLFEGNKTENERMDIMLSEGFTNMEQYIIDYAHNELFELWIKENRIV